VKVKLGFTMKAANLSELTDAVQEGLGELIYTTGLAIEALSKMTIMQSTPTGKIYIKASSWSVATHQADSYRTHQASAPGQPPAVDLGYLVNSIATVRVSKLTTAVVVYAEYGIYLEMGTVRMAPRPYLEPAFDENVAKIGGELKAIGNFAIKKVKIK
jgi:hypothetical protein